MSTHAARIRRWAQGYFGAEHVGTRGLLSEDVVDAYNELHPADRYSSPNPQTNVERDPS